MSLYDSVTCCHSSLPYLLLVKVIDLSITAYSRNKVNMFEYNLRVLDRLTEKILSTTFIIM